MPEIQWHCARKEDFLLREWQDGTVVFDDANGQLQCLTSVSGTVMQMLLGPRSWTASDIALELLGEPPTSDDVEMVENVLAQFSSLNFIERVPV